MATLADIEKSYDTAIEKAKANPEAVLELKSERSAAIAEYRLKEVAEREQALWKREALTAWPLAKEFEDRVVGDTEEAILASAQALHERIAKLFDQHQRNLEIQRIVEEHTKAQEAPPDAESA